MAHRPKYTKPDENQKEIVKELRKRGAVVVIVANKGGKCGDLFVAWRGKIMAVEVKQPGKENDLTPGELDFMEMLNGVGCRLIVATNADEIEKWF